MKRIKYAWAGTVATFLATTHQSLIQDLQQHVTNLFGGKANVNKISNFISSQNAAWVNEISVLTSALTSAVAANSLAGNWELILEYELPQQGGRRPDVIVLAGKTVVVLEFKMKAAPNTADLDQLNDYIRDLNYYHSEAQKAFKMCGALVLTKSTGAAVHSGITSLCPVSIANFLLSHASPGQILATTWVNGSYLPAPGVISAAIAGWRHSPPTLPAWLATNLPSVETTIRQIISAASQDLAGVRRLIIVTGEPGAGKTFVGLNLAHDTTVPGKKRFVSGNGPLVKVLNYALNQQQQIVTALHKFRDHFFKSQQPLENVIIFDEAQRTLDLVYMQQKFSKQHSEAYMMLEIITRTPNWGVLVLLAGTGQEIYKGEVGLQVWFDELSKSFQTTNWHVHCSKADIQYLTGTPTSSAFNPPQNVQVHNAPLHLNTALRQHGALDYAEWVESVLSGNSGSAAQHATAAGLKYFTLYVTRNVALAKQLVTDRYTNDPTKRYGILMVSGNDNLLRLHGVPPIPIDGQIEKWYLDPPSQRSSSCSLTSAASEFQCQGLDLDSTIVCWGDDLRWDSTAKHWIIKPVNVQPPVPNPKEMRLNKYRVVLTRARDGSVIFVPPKPSLNDTYDFLLNCGATPLP